MKEARLDSFGGCAARGPALQISIIAPVFDTAAPLLRAAARSVLGDATGGPAQLILVDDASSAPGTLRCLNALAAADRRVVVLRNPRNLGPASSRNHGLRAATGDWVGFLDADDVWLPGQFGRWRAMRAARPEARWLGMGHRSLRPDGQAAPAPRLPASVSGSDQAQGDGLHEIAGPALTALLLANFWLHLGATLTERRLLEQAGGFAEGLYYFEDFHLLAKLSTLAPLILSDAEGYGWRREDAGLTTSPRRLRGSSLAMHRLAAREPVLRGFRREIRWAHYSAMKGLAMNNLLAGRGRPALGFALRAWLIAPQEWRELALFLRLWRRGAPDAALGADGYSSAELFARRLSV